LAALGKFGTSHSASRREFASMSYRDQAIFLGEMVMVEPGIPLLAFSDDVAELVERAASSIVAVHGGGRWPSSGIHWRSGVIVTAEEVLERDENIKLTLPGGRVADASLAGRDPTTDVAVLRFQPDGLPVATTAEAPLRAGQVVVAVGNHDGAPLAALGIVAFAGGAWHSLRGGTIDSLIRLDLALSPAAEGGALVDLQDRVVGMTVLGPRHRALSIPSSTVDRAVDQLLARGHVFRGYLGAGLQPMKQKRASNGSQSLGSRRGVLVVSVDPNGPAARAGILVGDIVTAWNGQPIERVREIMRLLGSESVGNTVDLALIRGGAPTTLRVVIGERSVA
jgi:S1-C subfamily serine protease